MASIDMTMQNFQRHKKNFGLNRYHGLLPESHESGAEWLTETTSFGVNPGQLRMLSYTPMGAAGDSSLVVVLHGCRQTAAGYADTVGWRELADRFKFRLLCPQQTLQNNANRCFNWFQPKDVARTGGECQSIHSMVSHMNDKAGGKALAYITGLSAGGAMACAMLAAFPQLFEGGSIIAGLPFGCAQDMPSAFAAMHQPRPTDARHLGDRVRHASGQAGPWPTVAIWHGTADKTVLAANADELCKQWLDVHGLDATGAGHRDGRTEWRDATGMVRVTRFDIKGLGHGAPIAANGINACGRAAPFVLEAEISSSLVMAQAWGLGEAAVQDDTQADYVPHTTPLEIPRLPRSVGRGLKIENHGNNRHGEFIARTIHNAMEAAGLTKK